MSYTLVGGNFARTYTSEALASYSVKLLASQQSHFKVDGVAFILLDPKGFLFVLQVDGTGSSPGRAIFEGYNFDWNPALEHNVELTDKSGLSGTFTLSQALEAQGYTFTTLDALHAFVYAEPAPRPPAILVSRQIREHHPAGAQEHPHPQSQKRLRRLRRGGQLGPPPDPADHY